MNPSDSESEDDGSISSSSSSSSYDEEERSVSNVPGFIEAKATKSFLVSDMKNSWMTESHYGFPWIFRNLNTIQIAHFSIQNKPINQSVDLIKDYVRSNSLLESLQLYRTSLGNTAGSALIPVFYRLKNLRLLDLDGNDMDDCGVFLRDLIRRNRSLEVFDFCNNDLAASYRHLAEGLRMNSTLVELRLAGCGLNDTRFQPIADALQSNRTAIKVLDLRANRLQAISLNRVLEAVKVRGTIKRVCFGHNEALFIEQGSWDFLAQFLINEDENTSLCRLDLHACDLPTEATRAIFRALEVNSFLSAIVLDIRGEMDMQQYLESLPKMKALRCLTLQDYTFNEDAGKLIEDAHKKNTSIHCFHYSNPGQPLTEESDNLIAFYAGRNVVDGFIKGTSPLPRSVWPHVFSSFACVTQTLGHSFIFYALQSNLELMTRHPAAKRKRKSPDNTDHDA